MHKQLLCGVAAVAITAACGGVALAADAPVRAVKAPAMVAAPPPVWAGWYIGGHLGLAQGKMSASPHEGSTDDGIARVKPRGLVGGMHVGQNWQNNTFVYGWEADLSATGLNQTRHFPNENSRVFHGDFDLLASLRARVGMTFDPNLLLFLTGGLAYTQANFIQISPDGTAQLGKFNKFGWVLGLGADWKQTPNLSWRLEGLWYNFSGNKAFGHHGEFGNAKLGDVLVVRIGATYHYSDKRLKRDVALLSRRDDGVGIYRYRYLWSDQVYVGVMAQEVAKIHPEAVARGDDGFLRVDYARLGLCLMTEDEWAACSQPAFAMAA